ncbi:RagB/SusD family nutrient uptake outer membrane protein [Flaviaesturariibacter amylovorans]|uniref:RagB/SusD family nutrient uptake outer membrane protein n=1 Tax=Flaviaesturariibacter amylovorans TaxID=1084520 RepID=A0ABP8HJ14_9BACT
MRYLTYIICMLSLAAASCKKFVEVPTPDDRIVSDDVFSSDAKASGAMTAVYGNLINGGGSFINGFGTTSGGLSSDELQKFNPSAGEQEFLNNALTPTNTTLRTLWSSAYQSIYYANAILEGVRRSQALSAGVKGQLEGEARFVRALHYFYLVNYFGSVPLVTSTDYAVNSTLPRSEPAAVYQQIRADLIAARDLLPEAYVGSERIRPNRWTAVALLARTHLYNKEWTEAVAAASNIIGSGVYQLQVDPATVYLKTSREAIWQLSPNTGTLRETSLLRPTGTTAPVPQYFLPSSAMATFEPGDLRRRKWVDSVTHQGTRYYYPAKYRNTTTAVTEYYTVFRLAEVYLIRAEARLNTGDLDGAAQDLNIVRTRAGLPNTLATTAPDLSTAIVAERRRELFAEMGHRWLDLKRWNLVSAVLSPIKTGWQATDTLYPVPNDELLSNNSLTQNPGY